MRTPMAALVIVSTLLLTAAVIAQATSPPHLGQMPTAERVRASVKGMDAMETAAREMGAFRQLQQVIKSLAGPRFYRNQLTPDECGRDM